VAGSSPVRKAIRSIPTTTPGTIPSVPVAVVAPTPLPGFRIADRLTVYLVFDRVCGLPVLSFRFATAVTVRGE